MKKQKTFYLVESRYVFTITLIVIALTVLGVYFWGLGQHSTFFENSLITTTVLSLAFFTFITLGLYHGVKLKDNMGSIVNSYSPTSPSPESTDTIHSFDFDVDACEGLAGIVLSVVLWIFMAIVFSLAAWIFTNVLVLTVLSFAAMLYWIFFRALRLVFKNSNKSKGNLLESLKWGLAYTLLYNFWIYGIFLLIAVWKA